jgi:hypothetical protein
MGKIPQVGISPKCGLDWAITLGFLFFECHKPGGALPYTPSPLTGRIFMISSVCTPKILGNFSQGLAY